MDKTAEEDDVVFEKAGDIFQNDVFIGSYVMYPGPGHPPHPPLITGVVSVFFHVDTGDLYKVGVTILEENPESGTSMYYLDYPEDDFIVLADATLGRLASGQAIYTRLFMSRMWELRKGIIDDAS